MELKQISERKSTGYLYREKNKERDKMNPKAGIGSFVFLSLFKRKRNA